MRISDWSSDVCSSDLSCSASPCRPAPMRPRCWRSWGPYTIRRVASDRSSETHERHWPGPTGGVESKSTHGIAPCAGNQENRHESHSRYCRRVAAVGRDTKSAGCGKGVCVWVEPGGAGILKKKKKNG